MQTLKFLGNGSGFTDNHTNAFFVKGRSLVIIDLSMINLYKLLALQPEKYNKIFLFVTHIHDDHTSGIGMFLQYMYYLKQKTIYIVAPFEVRSALASEFEIKGIDSNAYIFKEPDKIKTLGISALAIRTEHSPELKNKCFGYIFYLDDRIIVYSGDTTDYKTWEKFAKRTKSELYLDMNCDYGKVHLLFDDVKEEVTKLAEETDVYLMHIDNMDKMKELIKDTNIHIAETI